MWKKATNNCLPMWECEQPTHVSLSRSLHMYCTHRCTGFQHMHKAIFQKRTKNVLSSSNTSRRECDKDWYLKAKQHFLQTNAVLTHPLSQRLCLICCSRINKDKSMIWYELMGKNFVPISWSGKLNSTSGLLLSTFLSGNLLHSFPVVLPMWTISQTWFNSPKI